MKIIPAVLANLFTLLLTACGGGGGATGITGNAGLGGSVTNGVSITALNAPNVAAAVLNGIAAVAGSSAGGATAPPLIGVAINGTSGNFSLPGLLLDQLAHLPDYQGMSNNSGIVGVGIGLNTPCAISGSATLLSDTDIADPNFLELNIGDTLSVEFFLCNQIGVVLDGTISIFVADIAGGGPYDPTMAFNITLEVTYTALRALDGSDYYYWDGDMMTLVLADDGAGNISSVMSGVSLDTSYNNQYPLSTAYHDQRLTDYLFVLTEDNAGTYTIDLDGTVESLDIDGTVTFTTTDTAIDPTVAAFTGNEFVADNPLAGVLLMQSTEPLATGSQLRLTADMNGIDVMIEVDSNGDGFYEPPTIIRTWAELEAL